MSHAYKTPRPHQIDFAHFHRRTGPYSDGSVYIKGLLGSMAWHDMGRGKTLSSLWEARELINRLRQGGVLNPRFMVVCPVSAVTTWKQECQRECPDLVPHMIIYPYSQLHNAIKSLKYFDLRMIIFDESHAMKSTDTDRIKTVAGFFNAIGTTNYKFEHGRIILATGTPLPNHAAELYTSWAMCSAKHPTVVSDWLTDQKRIDDWKRAFSKKIDISWTMGKGKNKRAASATKLEGLENEELLQKLMKPIVHYRPRIEGIPTAHEIEIDLGLSDDKLLEDADIEKPEAYMAAVERLSRAKTPYLINWVKDFLASNKEQLIVFSLNRYAIDILKEHFPKDVRIMVGSGEGSKKEDRARNIVDFQEKKFRVFAMTYACGAESLNLQQCQYTVYHGYPWNDAKRRQAMARTDRPGQKFETYHYFLMSGNNDHKVMSAVKAKGETERRAASLFVGDNSAEQTLIKPKSLVDLYL